jgi:hypothetical protein
VSKTSPCTIAPVSCSTARYTIFGAATTIGRLDAFPVPSVFNIPLAAGAHSAEHSQTLGHQDDITS